MLCRGGQVGLSHISFTDETRVQIPFAIQKVHENCVLEITDITGQHVPGLATGICNAGAESSILSCSTTCASSIKAKTSVYQTEDCGSIPRLRSSFFLVSPLPYCESGRGNLWEKNNWLFAWFGTMRLWVRAPPLIPKYRFIAWYY